MSDGVFFKSEQGSKAAWKGFSSQTIYIANRLLFLDDDSDFFPERAEDLMLQKDGTVTELVQVKNLSSDLVLSDLFPQKEDSFFKRCLYYKAYNESLSVKIISFGIIGSELRGFADGLKESINSVKTKLLQYGYLEDEVAWFISNLKIENADEVYLISAINEKLNSLIETMAAPNIIFDVLTNYVSNLSRTGDCTSKEKWERFLQTIGIHLASLSGMAKQYGNTILPIYVYKQNKSCIDLKNEYLAGVNTLPQHIRANLDVPRVFWVEKIKEAFQDNQIVVIRGASGQGKSSLAYRFLMDKYVECDILCIEKLTDEQQTIDIRSALSGIAKNRSSSIVVYLDVTPYDTNWVWLCEKLTAQSEVQLLITIREEDFRRSPVDYSKHFFKEIELLFNKEEASELFLRYHDHDFLSFSDAWTSFGETGPLMEFTYMLNQAETLKNRLTSQINQISQNETYADEWLNALTIISYAGKYSIPVNLKKLFLIVSCKQKRKMLKIFEKEYFLRETNNGNSVECLHALRASLLYDIICDDILFPELDVIVSVIKTINENALIMIVAYIYNNGVDSSLINKLASFSYDSWVLYAGVLKALLWAEVFDYYQKNKKVIQEGNAFINSSFTFVCMGDVTGYLDHLDMETLWDSFIKDNPNAKVNMLQILDKLTSNKISYQYVDIFIQKTIQDLPINKTLDANELTPAGYSLFWIAKRGYIISEKMCNLHVESLDNYDLLDNYLNYLVGIQEQKWESLYNSIYPYLKKQIQSKYNLILFHEVNRELSVVSIFDIFRENGRQQFGNNYTMEVLRAIRRLSSLKEKYNVEIIGHEVIEGITFPDMQKQIQKKNLPWIWITQLNEWLNKLNAYDNIPPTWDICIKNINDTRSKVILAINSLLKGLEHLYKKSNAQKLADKDHIAIFEEAYKRVNDLYSYSPQSEVDKYGICLSNAVVPDLIGSFELSKKEDDKSKTFNRVFREYCSSISNFIMQKETLLLERIKNEPISNFGRLSLVNLISALETLPLVQDLYRQELFLKAPDFDNENEYQQLLLLTTIWTYLFNNTLRTENSTIYNQKLYLKNYREKIKKFFENELSDYDNVQKIIIKNKSIEVLVDAEAIDDFCLLLLADIKKRFPEIFTLSFEGFLWDEYFNELQIKMQVLGDELPGGYCISSKHFKLHNVPDKFMSFRMPIEGDDKDFIHSTKNDIINCYSNQQLLYILARHTVQVNCAVEKIGTQCINSQIYDVWRCKAECMIIDICNDISKTFKQIYDALTKTGIITSTFVNLVDTLDELTKNASAIVQIDNIEMVKPYIDDLGSDMNNFVNLLPQRLFIEIV